MANVTYSHNMKMYFGYDVYRAFAVLSIVLFVAAGGNSDQGMFSSGEGDGFFQQINAVVEQPYYGGMGFVHKVRFFVVSPFYYMWKKELIVGEYAVLLLFMLPLILYRRNKRASLLMPVLLALPFLFSFRSILCMCSMAYLYFYVIEGRSARYLILSALLSVLSSGVLLTVVFVMMLHIERLYRRHGAWVIFAGLGFVGVLAPSLIHKIDFFGQGGLMDFVSRGNLFVYYQSGNYMNFYFYVTIFVLSIFVIFLSSQNWKRTQNSARFYLPVLPAFLFEGLGVLAYTVVLMWYVFFNCAPTFTLTGKVD